MAIAPKPLDFKMSKRGEAKAKDATFRWFWHGKLENPLVFNWKYFISSLKSSILQAFTMLLRVSFGWWWPNPAKHFLLSLNWASESAKALFHETKLLLAPMKFPRPGLPWDSWRTCFWGKQTGHFGEAATALGHNIFYWLSRDGGVWKCVMIALPNKVTSASGLTMFNVPTIQQLPCHLVRCKAKSIKSINHRDSHRQVAKDWLFASIKDYPN